MHKLNRGEKIPAALEVKLRQKKQTPTLGWDDVTKLAACRT